MGDAVDGDAVGGDGRVVEEADDGQNGGAETRREQDLRHVQRLAGVALLLRFFVCRDQNKTRSANTDSP